MADASQYAQWIINNADKRGTPEFETVSQAYQLAKDPGAKYKAKSQPVPVNPTDDMNILQTGAAGLGKMMVDTGRGIKQLIGPADPQGLQKRIDDESDLTKPLMNTWGGNIGNIAGQVGLALLPGGLMKGGGRLAGAPGLTAAGGMMMAPPSTLTGLGVGAVQGAAQGVIQPVTSDQGFGRLTNTAVGGVAGGLVPAAGMALGTIRGAVQPLYEGGRQQIVGDAMRQATGPNTNQVINNLQNSQVLVPGSLPTSAEVGNSGGLAALQRAASAVDPESYAFRGQQQNAARVAALQDMAGTGGQRDFYAANRDATANQLYKQAYDKGVDIARDPNTGQFLPKAEIAGRKGEITKLMQRPAIQDAVKEARTLAQNEGVKIDPAGSVKGLDYVKRALDDQISKATGNEQRVLVNLKNRLLTTVDTMSPDYAAARTVFRDMSRPINQMDIAQDLATRSINPLTGVMQPQAFARNLTDDTAARATGFNRATLQDIMEPQQLGILNAMRDDLARSVAAQNLGRGAGSDTTQKLAMTNLMQQSGLPLGIMNLPGVGRAGNWVYQMADDRMRQQLAQALLDPRQAAQLMQAAQRNPALAQAIEQARAIAAPAILGGAMSLQSR